MSKLTSKDKQKIVAGLIEVLKKHEVGDSVYFYFDDKRVWVDRNTGKLVERNGFNPKDYFEWFNEKTVTLAFDDSPLFDLINYEMDYELFETMAVDIQQVVTPYGLYWDLGNDWNLSFYDCKPNGNNTPEPGEEVIHIHLQDHYVPEELLAVSDWWIKQSEAYGDVGSCVLGAGFKFRYQDKFYFMPPLSRWQGSCSWEASKDRVQEKLVAVGAVEVEYKWGVMD